MACRASVVLVMFALSASGPIHAEGRRATATSTANPVRKVVSMLQRMQKQVTAEGEKEQTQFDKYMCYCKETEGALTQSIEDAEDKITSLSSGFTSSGEQKAQTKQNLKGHQDSRSDAKGTLEKASALRQKEDGVFRAEEAEMKANIEALKKAIKAMESGMAGSFLQTSSADVVRRFAIYKAMLSDDTRQELLAFLSQTQGYAPQSGEIVGILKQMLEEMQKDLAEATAEEEASVKSFEELSAAKAKEAEALTKQIEGEMIRVGELGVEVTSTGFDLDDTKKSLAQDTKFLAELKGDCATKAKEWDAVKQSRADELVALGETIKILNDDDALELFKQTLPSSGESFVQIQVSQKAVRARALAAIRTAKQHSRGMHLPARPSLDLISLALAGKKAGFEKVISMIDTMVAGLNEEQKDDDKKKDYCDAEFDKADDQKKGLERAISDSNAAIEEMKGSIATLEEELAALEAGIKALDKSVAEATALRKSEHQEYSDLMSDTSASKEVLLAAKNRLNKYYNPKLYKPKEDADATSPTFLQVSARARGVPPPPAEAFSVYVKRRADGNGVAAMIDLLVKDLDKQLTEAETMEKDAQAEYEDLLAEAGVKRANDAKSITDKEAAKSEEQEALEAETDSKASSTKALTGKLEFIRDLHGECDWLLKFYEARKGARSGEVESLASARAVLSGADYSLLQAGRSTRTLRGVTKHL